MADEWFDFRYFLVHGWFCFFFFVFFGKTGLCRRGSSGSAECSVDGGNECGLVLVLENAMVRKSYPGPPLSLLVWGGRIFGRKW